MSTTHRKTVISSPDAPAAIGPYVQAIRTGDLLFTAGQVAFDPATMQIVEGGITAETERVMLNLKAVLAAAGLTFADVVKTTVFMADLGEFAAMNEVYARHIAEGNAPPPGRSTVQVAALPRNARVEIECVASYVGK